MVNGFFRHWGRKLAALHNRNIWVTAVLALTGLILPWAWFRKTFPQERVWTRDVHLAAGIVSILFILYYLLFLAKHIRQLGTKTKNLANLIISLFLLIGLAVSGVILWQFRHFPSAWNSSALYVHDLFSWIGIPYLLYHSLTRLRWVKKLGYRPIVLKPAEADPDESDPAGMRRNPGAVRRQPDQRESGPDRKYPEGIHPAARTMTRRGFIKGAVAVVLLAAVGPAFVRWLLKPFSTGGGLQSGGSVTAHDANDMEPKPLPAPASSPPKGGGAQGSFRIYTVTDMPKFTDENWAFTIDGLVENPQNWQWEAFLKLPRKVQVSDFHCVTGWTVNHCTWEGIPVSELLKLAKVKPQAKQVKFISGDGVYTDALTLQQANMDDVMVAVLLDGNLLPRDNGGPARLIVPKMYGYKSVKWLTGMQLIDTNHIGYWEQRGYDKDAWLGGQMVDHPELEYG